jgi:hypothetical protein
MNLQVQYRVHKITPFPPHPLVAIISSVSQDNISNPHISLINPSIFSFHPFSAVSYRQHFTWIWNARTYYQSHACYMPHLLIILCFIIPIMANFITPANSSVLNLNTLLSTALYSALILCYSLNVGDKVTYLYKIQWKNVISLLSLRFYEVVCMKNSCSLLLVTVQLKY